MTRRIPFIALVAALLVTAVATPAWAQPPAPSQPTPSRSLRIGGYAMVGQFTFAASQSFTAVFGTDSGTIAGGGVTVGLPFGLFVDVGAWQFTRSGERVLVLDSQVIPLGIPLELTIVPIEMSAGWQFRMRRVPRLRPYAAVGYSSFGYRETSSFSASGEDVDERFGGYHLRGGAEFKFARWLGVAGEVAWTQVLDAIGTGGVSAAFRENDLGGTSFRARFTVGQ